VRGMPVYQIKKMFPEVIICSSDYYNYSIFADRMYSIVLRYADHVEPYSIDECFALIEKVDLAQEIKRSLQSELGITFSLGVADTKVLAKLASSSRKPDGLTIITKGDIESFLRDIQIGAIWGIGRATASELRRMGVMTALDLYKRTLDWAGEHLNKSTQEIWHELRGISVMSLQEEEELHKSIQSTKTFRPFSSNREVILSELSKNTENASVKAKREGLLARRINYFIKTRDFRFLRYECPLPEPTNSASIIVGVIKKTFSKVFLTDEVYRATGITLANLVPEGASMTSLFSKDPERSSKSLDVAIEKLERRYGTHVVALASSLGSYRRQDEKPSKRLSIPFIKTDI